MTVIDWSLPCSNVVLDAIHIGHADDIDHRRLAAQVYTSSRDYGEVVAQYRILYPAITDTDHKAG